MIDSECDGLAYGELFEALVRAVADSESPELTDLELYLGEEECFWDGEENHYLAVGA